MIKECNPKLKLPNKICNPKTGRWVLRTSKTGKEIIAAAKSPNASIKIQKTKVNVNNKLKFNYGTTSKYRDVFLNIFNKNRKKGVDIYSIDRIGESTSRTRAEMYSTSLKFTNPNSVIKRYGTQQSHKLPTFLKITKIRKTWGKDIRKRLTDIRESSLNKEIQLYKVCNLLQDDNVLDTVAYCLNDKIVHKNWGIHNDSVYISLFTENLTSKGFVTFKTFIFKNLFVPEDVIFQLLYTIHCFESIGLKHMDLHYENFYIKDLGKEENVTYEMFINGRIESFYVKRRHLIKIIDFDGGSKTKPRPYVNSKYNTVISNPGELSGLITGKKAPGQKVDLLKIIKTLTDYNYRKITKISNLHNIETKYKKMKITNDLKNVPFITRTVGFKDRIDIKDSKTMDILIKKFGTTGFLVGHFKSYGFLWKDWIGKHPTFLDIHDDIILGTDVIIASMVESNLFQTVFRPDKVFSQRRFLKN